MGDDQHAHLWPGEGVDALGDRPQRVDVDPGVGLVENRDLGTQQGSWRISIRFFSPPEKPSLR